MARAIRLHAFHADDAVAPIGFSLHLADIFLAELDAAVAVAVPEAPLGVLMDVFIEALQRTRQPALLHRIRCGSPRLCRVRAAFRRPSRSSIFPAPGVCQL